MHDEAAWTLLLSQQATNDLGEFAPWAQIVATAVITGLFVWTIMYRDPAERKENRVELNAARADYLKSIEAERQSREEANSRFMAMITENRERSHEQRMEDRKVYQDSTRVMLQEFLAAIREIRNGKGT